MKSTIFIRLLLQLTIVVILIILIVGALVYRYTNIMLKEQALIHNNELLGQTEKIVAQAMEEVEQLALSLAINSDIQKTMLLKWDIKNDYSSLKSTSDIFTDRINSSKYLQSIYLYSSINQKLISNSGIIEVNEYSNHLGLQNFIDSPNTMTWRADELALTPRQSNNVISFHTSVPISGIQKKGVLLINLKEDVLYNAVINTNNSMLGDVAILDNEGKILSYKDKGLFLKKFDKVDINQIIKEQQGYFINDIDGTPTLVSFLTSSHNGWKYLTLKPYEEVVKKSNELLFITLMVSLTSLFIGVLLIVFVSRRHYQPVKEILQEITSHKNIKLIKPSKDEFSFIQESIHQLFQENTKFKAKFQHSQLILKDHVILNLLSGMPLNDEKIIQQVQHHNINLSPENFIVLVLRINIKNEFEVHTEQKVLNLIQYKIRVLCEEVMKTHGRGIYVSQFHKEDVIIMNTEQWGKKTLELEKVKEMAFLIKNSIKEQMPVVTVTFGIGVQYKRISEISRSYNEAKEALLYERIAGEGSILSFNEVQLNHKNRNEFIEYQKRIKMMENELKIGNLERACGIKDAIIKKIQDDMQFGYIHKEIVLNHLLNSLAIIRFEVIEDKEKEDDPNLYIEFAKLHNLNEIQSWLGDVMSSIATKLQGKRENKNVEVIEKLTLYINRHFREHISLQTLSDLVYMNSYYLSKLFKEVTGQNFSDYLTEIRFKEACKLLIGTRRNINDIASEVGFGHKQNFIRTFKKYTGTTPTQYRKQSLMERNTHDKV
ncbi:helix-turn-helix domain-containing protein [Lederbergia lenta]|uniref:helix-turn-helix domain-containing protein n=1 Tax=Lederbergia lenta TaxID=1467 RepID=UPI00204033F5|nr:helix-turn-helix domain-containing protein [Lederbergia lenta]MCM3112174.1 helix-turn-helix domain-containing protein [Lederbergia lenta]